MRRYSLDPGGSGLSHFERDFLNFLGSRYLVLEAEKRKTKGE